MSISKTVVLIVGVALSGSVVVCSVFGQARVQQAAGSRPPEEQLRIRGIIGLGPRARTATPVYQTSVGSGVKRPQEWQVISVTYDTHPVWIDELVVQFHVMTMMPDPETRQPAYSLYRKTVRYADIEQGREHRAMTFLRPAAVKRFGNVVACAAVFTLEGVVVAEPSDQSVELPESWWRNPSVLDSPVLTVREGYLLNRVESPWMLVNPDDYEVIR